MRRFALLLLSLVVLPGVAHAQPTLELVHDPPRRVDAAERAILEFVVRGRYASEEPPTLTCNFRVRGAVSYHQVTGLESGYGRFLVTIPRGDLPRKARVVIEYFAELTRSHELVARYRNAVEPARTTLVLTEAGETPRAPAAPPPAVRRRAPRRVAVPTPTPAAAAPTAARPLEEEDPVVEPGTRAEAGIQTGSWPRRDVSLKLGLNLGAMYAVGLFSESERGHSFEDLWIAWSPSRAIPGELTLDVMLYWADFFAVAPGFNYFFYRSNAFSHYLGLRVLIRGDPDYPVPGAGVVLGVEVGISRLVAFTCRATFDLATYPAGAGPVPAIRDPDGAALDDLVVPMVTLSVGVAFRFL